MLDRVEPHAVRIGLGLFEALKIVEALGTKPSPVKPDENPCVDTSILNRR